MDGVDEAAARGNGQNMQDPAAIGCAVVVEALMQGFASVGKLHTS